MRKYILAADHVQDPPGYCATPALIELAPSDIAKLQSFPEKKIVCGKISE
jgi:hypothetical protein